MRYLVEPNARVCDILRNGQSEDVALIDAGHAERAQSRAGLRGGVPGDGIRPRSRWARLGWSIVLALGVMMGSASAPRALETLELTAPGASDALLESLRASSLLIAARNAGHTDPVDLMAAARAEYGRLINLLYEDGYYAPVIHVTVDGREASEVSALSTPSRIDHIAVRIELGPRFTFGRIGIEPLAPGTVMPPGFAPGQPARSTVVRDAVAAALDGWRALGYARARVSDQQVVANHRTHRLNVSLRIVTGPQIRIGTVVPQGNATTRSDRIVAIAGLESGALDTPEAIAAAERRLRLTGTFTSVQLSTADHDNPDGTTNIVALVDEAPPRRLGFGIEADTVAGIRLTGFWLHRNLFHGAERLRLEATVDGIAAQTAGLGFSLDARYTRPATFNRDTDLELGLRAVRMNERDYDADAFEANATLARRFSSKLFGSFGINLRYETAAYSGLTGDFGTLGLPISATQDTRDDPLDATRGHYLMAEVMPYVGFGQAESGARLRFDGRIYNDARTDGRLVFAARAQLGAIVGSSLNGTPRGFLFYSGGGGSVRGMPYQSLGVVGPPASGGRGFAAVSGEVRWRVNDSISLAAFVDAGYVSSGAFTGSSDWQAGGGLGVRYITPVGPLRLSVATPIRRNASAAGSNPVQLYLGIGQAF